MKIKKLSTTGYGKFDGHQWTDLSPGINVFYGENEAGKSTIFKMMVDVLFGFKINKKDKHPAVSRLSNQLNVQSQIVKDGQEYHIDRALKDKGQMTLVTQGKQYEYGNLPLDMVDHITRQTYEEIYAMDLNRLTGLKDTSWDEIQELLLKQYSGDTFKSAKEVLQEIEGEMTSIKRQTDRGNSRLKSLEQERRDLFKKKKLLQERLMGAELLQEKLDKLSMDIEAIKGQKVALHHRLNLLETYLPVLLMIQEKEKLTEHVQAFMAYEDLNESTYNFHKKAVRDLYQKMDSSSEKVGKYVAEKRRLTELLESEDLNEVELQSVYQKYLSLSDLKADINERLQELTLLEKQVKKEFENTFDEAFQDKHVQDVLEINHLSLKALVKELEEVYEEIKVLKRNKRLTRSNHSGSYIGLFVLLAIIAGVIFYMNIQTLYNYIATGVVGFSLMGIIHQFMKKRFKSLNEEDLFNERDDLRSRLLKELNGIRLSSIAAEFAGQELLTQILNLRHLCESYQKSKIQYEQKFNTYELVDQEVAGYLKRHVGDPDQSRPFDVLLERLNVLKQHGARIQVINEQLDVMNDSMQQIEAELNDKEYWLNAADDFLKRYGEGDIKTGIRRMERKHQDMLRIQEIDKRLQGLDYMDSVLERFREEYDPESQSFDKAYVLTEIELISNALNDKIIEHANTMKDYQVIMEQNDLSVVNGQLQGLDEEIEQCKRQYDKLLLLQHIISTADEQYRLENQPEVFKHAGSHLSLITDGRYSGLEVVEVQKGKYVIQVRSDHQVMTVDETFSMGTLNQIYLSLRLSLIDHLDQSRSQLPVCFDELLVNWDEKRLAKTLEIIHRIAETRQVMLFTCHQWFLEAVEAMSDVKVYRL